MAESRSCPLGFITLDMKQTGAPSAGNPHAGCDVAGAGAGFTVGILRHSRGNGSNKLDLTFGIPRQSSTLPYRVENLLPSCCPHGFDSVAKVTEFADHFMSAPLS